MMSAVLQVYPADGTLIVGQLGATDSGVSHYMYNQHSAAGGAETAATHNPR